MTCLPAHKMLAFEVSDYSQEINKPAYQQNLPYSTKQQTDATQIIYCIASPLPYGMQPFCQSPEVYYGV